MADMAQLSAISGYGTDDYGLESLVMEKENLANAVMSDTEALAENSPQSFQ